MSIQHNVEFRVSKARIVMETMVLGGFFLFVTVFPLFFGKATASVLIYVAVLTIVDVYLARLLYWRASLAYVISDHGITIKDYRGDKFLPWDSIAGVREWPFVGATGQPSYNLELKNGKTQKLHLDDDAFIDCLKFYLPQTKYWWSAE